MWHKIDDEVLLKCNSICSDNLMEGDFIEDYEFRFGFKKIKRPKLKPNVGTNNSTQMKVQERYTPSCAKMFPKVKGSPKAGQAGRVVKGDNLGLTAWRVAAGPEWSGHRAVGRWGASACRSDSSGYAALFVPNSITKIQTNQVMFYRGACALLITLGLVNMDQNPYFHTLKSVWLWAILRGLVLAF